MGISTCAHISSGDCFTSWRLSHQEVAHYALGCIACEERKSETTSIAQLVYLDDLHPADVEIGDNCTIGFRTSIFAHFYWGPRRPTGSGKVIIEKDVFVGPHCVILPNVRIGEGAVIRAGTLVSRNVPAHALWGSPAAGVPRIDDGCVDSRNFI